MLTLKLNSLFKKCMNDFINTCIRSTNETDNGSNRYKGILDDHEGFLEAAR